MKPQDTNGETRVMIVDSESLACQGLAALIAGIVGYFCLKLVFWMITSVRFHVFAYYCWALGLLALALGLGEF